MKTNDKNTVARELVIIMITQRITEYVILSFLQHQSPIGLLVYYVFLLLSVSFSLLFSCQDYQRK